MSVEIYILQYAITQLQNLTLNLDEKLICLLLHFGAQGCLLDFLLGILPKLKTLIGLTLIFLTLWVSQGYKKNVITTKN